MRCLAFDLGASSGKLFAGSIRSDRLIVERVHSFPNEITHFSGGLYWDFFRILRQMNEGIQKASAMGPIDTFGVDSFNNDFSLIDASGGLLLPIRCYRDPRTEMAQSEIYQRISPRKLYSYTGNQLAPFNTFMQLASMALAGQGPILNAADSLLLLPDLLGYSITGIKHAEYTAAAETQFLDLNDRRWIQEVLDVFAIPGHILPPIVMPGTRIGRASKAFCDRNRVDPFEFIAVCQHDTASAFIGSYGKQDAALLSSGTWSLVGLEVKQPIVNDESYAHNIANEGGFPGHHRLIKNVMGSWVLQELLREYAAEGMQISFEQMQDMAAQAKARQFLFDPDAPEFFRPGNMREKIRRACIRTMGRAPERPGDFFRCVYEGLALCYRHALDVLEAVSGKSTSVVNILGGGSNDAFACQCTADVIDRLVVAGPADATAIGNLLVQLIAVGELASMAQARELVTRSFLPKEYRPSTEASIWNDQYQRFLSIKRTTGT